MQSTRAAGRVSRCAGFKKFYYKGVDVEHFCFKASYVDLVSSIIRWISSFASKGLSSGSTTASFSLRAETD